MGPTSDTRDNPTRTIGAVILDANRFALARRASRAQPKLETTETVLGATINDYFSFNVRRRSIGRIWSALFPKSNGPGLLPVPQPDAPEIGAALSTFAFR